MILQKALVSVGLAVLVTSTLWAQEIDWAALEGRPIAAINIVATEVFDPQQPGEDLRIFSWANALHIRTRYGVIERELLFQVGDRIDPRLINESERNLRGLGIFQDAVIIPEDGPEGVTLQVRTSDRWSTKLITDISSEGDITRLRLGLENSNFLGRAKKFGGTVEASTDVDALNLFFSDPRVLGTRWGLGLRYLDTSLSDVRSLSVNHPFYSDDVSWGGEFLHLESDGERRVFYSGGLADSLSIDELRNEGFIAHQAGNARLRRIAFVGSQQRLTRDVESRRVTVGVSWALMRRRFRTMRRIDFFGISEDVAAGWVVQLLAGADLVELGADVNRPAWRVDGSMSWFLGKSSFLGTRLRHHGFARQGRLENSRTLVESWGYWQSGVQTLAWSLGAVAVVREPEYVRMTLGGDSRLRGYPARHQAGTRALWMNVEERLFSNIRVFFLNFGAAAFVDVAQAWEDSETPSWRRFDIGTGVGLRIGNNKSGSGVLRLDLAYGKDGPAFSLASGSFIRVARVLGFPAPGLIR